MSPILGVLASGITASKIVTASYESIASNTGPIGSGITFNSIPQTYVALQLRFNNVRMASGYGTNKNLRLRFNNSSTQSQYVSHYLANTNASVLAGAYVNDGVSTGIFLLGGVAAAGATYGGCGVIDIYNYTSTTQNKTVRAFSGNDQNGSGDLGLASGLYMVTSAITRIDITVAGYADTGTVELYGIKG